MTWQDVVLHGLNVCQVVALAGIAVWAQRTASRVDEINGDVHRALRKRSTDAAGWDDGSPAPDQPRP